ncbi:hypothetical protein HQ403_02645 [Candidatus Kaiserbacteria bacterium]|nr:hypothetical protein [Candidatus Kaiserbacteria bacterium]
MKKTLIILVALFMVTAFSASAATFKVGDVYEYKGSTQADDIYIAGGSIDVSGDINGDGVIAGGDVSIIGDISQDATVVGGSIRLLGSVGDDARITGGNITISSDIAGDLVAAGGFIKTLSGSTISGDVVIAGGTIFIDGNVGGDLTIYGEEVRINGEIKGNVNLKFTKKVILGENAIIVGNLTYSADKDIEMSDGTVVGGIVTRLESPVHRFDFDKNDIGKVIGFLFLVKLLLMLVAGVLAVVVFKKFSKTVGEHTYEDFWKNALIGFITLIVVPVAVILLFATILGICVGFILLGAYVLMLIISKVLAGIVVGGLLSKWIKKETIIDWKWAVLGIVALQVISFVPLFGGIAALIIVLATFGTLGTLAYKRFWITR